MPNQELLGITSPEAVNEQPFKVFILKSARDCNLNCNYCYMYNLADQSWKQQPAVMSDEVVNATAERGAEHAKEYSLDRVLVAFHGGEPVLVDRKDPEYYVRATNAFRRAMKKARGSDTELYFGIQTNGTLLNRDNLDRFSRLNIGVGVSIDGGLESHDRNRRYANGKGSFREAIAGLTLLRKYPEINSTILCVIDLENDPVRTYRNLAAFGTKSLEFILPLAHWSTPPKRNQTHFDPTDYADWLIPVFEEWKKTPERPHIPLFEEINHLIRGGKASLEYIGGTASDNIVVETDGGIEDTDTLKSVGDGITKLGLNVFDNSFAEALRHPKVRLRQMGRAALSDTCRKCDLVEVCGGGYMPHRYKEGSSIGDEFKNPSVYCGDLYKLIAWIAMDIIQEGKRRQLLENFVNGADLTY